VRPKPIVVVLVGVVFTAFSAILIRLADAPSLAIAAWRMVLATGMAAPLFVAERFGRAPRRESGSSASALTRKAAVALSLASGALLAMHFAFWIASLSYTSVASSTVLVTTHPLIVAVFGFVLLDERLSVRSVLFMLASLAGSALLVAGGYGAGGSVPLGNLLAFLGAVTVSGYMVIGRVVRRRLSVHAYTMIVYATAAFLLVAASAVGGVPLAPYAPREFVLFAALAFFCTLLGHSLYNWALAFLRPTVISTSILGEPVIASVLAVIVFGEVPSIFTITGGAVILGSIYLFVREEARLAREQRSNAT